MRTGRLVLLLIAAVLFAAACFFCDERLRSLLFASARISAGTCLIAVPLGVFFAVVFTKTDLPGRRYGPAVLAPLLLMPLYVHTAGWETIIGKLGWWTFSHGGVARAWLSGEAAAVWIHGIAAWPWVALIVGVGLGTVDPASEDTARLALSPRDVLLRVTLPWVLPYILLAALWTAVTAAGEMTVTNIYMLRTYAEEIYSLFALEPSPAAALRGIFPALLLLAASVLFGLTLLPGNRDGATAATFTPPPPFATSANRRLVAAATWMLLGLLTCLPLSGLVHRAGVYVARKDARLERHWSPVKAVRITAESAVHYRREWTDTLRIAGAAATASVLLLLIPVWFARSYDRSREAAWLLAIPAFIPGPLVGMAIIYLLNRPESSWFTTLYQRTSVPPVLAVMTRALPVAGWILLSAFAAVPRELLDNARLYGRSPLQRAWLVVRGSQLPALIAAWLAAFAVAAGDLACSILVLPPGVFPVSYRIFSLLHAGADDQVAGMSLLLVLGILAAGIGMRKLRNRSDGFAQTADSPPTYT